MGILKRMDTNNVVFELKYPDLYLEDIEWWLEHFDLVLMAKGISSEYDKFEIMANNLERTKIRQVIDIVDWIRAGNAVPPYQALRREMKYVLGKDGYQAAAVGMKLKGFKELAMCPSTWLSALDSLWDGVDCSDVLKELFLSRLPARVQFEIDERIPLDELCLKCDDFFTEYGEMKRFDEN